MKLKKLLPILLPILLLISSLAHAAEHAVVIMYHRFGENKYPSTNTTIPQFEAHLQELATGGYTVLPLIQIVKSIAQGNPLPDKSVAITIDDAYASVYNEAFPRLKEYGFPFTLFVATEPIDRKFGAYMTWQQIRELHQSEGADIGSQTHSHPHLHRISLEEARAEIMHSNKRFMEELGEVPLLHAYPFGEYSPEVRDLMGEMGFIAAFGQHSGVMHSSVNPFEYPRFTFNEAYGSLERLKLAINSVALPVGNHTPPSMVIEYNPPLIGFTFEEGFEPQGQLNCFVTAQGQVETITLGNRVEIRLNSPIKGERARLNCTMPYRDNNKNTGRWHWFGRQFVQP